MGGGSRGSAVLGEVETASAGRGARRYFRSPSCRPPGASHGRLRARPGGSDRPHDRPVRTVGGQAAGPACPVVLVAPTPAARLPKGTVRPTDLVHPSAPRWVGRFGATRAGPAGSLRRDPTRRRPDQRRTASTGTTAATGLRYSSGPGRGRPPDRFAADPRREDRPRGSSSRVPRARGAVSTKG